MKSLATDSESNGSAGNLHRNTWALLLWNCETLIPLLAALRIAASGNIVHLLSFSDRIASIQSMYTGRTRKHRASEPEKANQNP